MVDNLGHYVRGKWGDCGQGCPLQEIEDRNGKLFPNFNATPICPIHVVTFTLISNLATDYIQKRKGDPGLFFFEYNLSPNLISK